jgi:short subunit dehydrogenase-like uncharacterized protein
MSYNQIALYGANGYTGKLILEELNKQGFKPLLLGRNKKAIEALAVSHALDFDVCAASEIEPILKKNKSIKLLINAAGPFIETAKYIAQSCINQGIHYLDVAGEIAVFKQLLELDEAAKKQGVMLLPGAGFDVVPTDCMANALVQEMPDATELILAFAGLGGGVSRGTARTALKQIDSGTWVREDGKLKKIKWLQRSRKIDFGPFKATCLPIPWGDLQTAWVSTGVANISVYVPFSKKIRRWLPALTKLMQTGIVNRLALAYVGSRITGPNAEKRAVGQTHIIGKAKNANGQELRKHLVTPDGYTFTALATVQLAKHVLIGNLKTGYQTPAMAYGANLVSEIKDVSWLSR